MILREISDTSIAVSLFRHFYKCYGKIGQKFIDEYHSSQTYRLSKGIWEKTKVCFRYSFLGRITETRQAPLMALDNSRTVQSLVSFYKRWKEEIICYSKGSSAVNVAEDIREQLILSPVKIISIIVVTAVLVNAVLTVILQKQMDLWDFFIRVLFLFAGAAGLSCQADWSTVKESSILLRKMQEG